MGVLGQNGGDFLGLGDGEDFCLRSYYVSGQNGVGKPPPPPITLLVLQNSVLALGHGMAFLWGRI